MFEPERTLVSRRARSIAAMVLTLASAVSAVSFAGGPPARRDPDVRVDRAAEGSASPAKLPRVIVRGDRVYATYLDRRYFVAYEPYFATSVNQGGTWNATDRRINSEPPGAMKGDMSQSLIANSGDDNVYALFVTNNFSQSLPIVNSSNDRGATWPRTAVALAVDDLLAVRGDFGIVAGSAGNGFAFWYDNRNNVNRDQTIWVRKTGNGGSTWNTAVAVNIPDVVSNPVPPDPRERSTQPSACVVGNASVRFAWRDKRDTDSRTFIEKPGRILYRGSDTNGNITSSNPEVRLDRASGTTEFESERPMITCAGTTLAVAWADDRNADATLENWDVYVSVSTNGGTTWSSNPVRVDNGPGSTSARNPKIAIGGGTPAVIYVAWEDTRSGGTDVYFARSTNSGASFSTPTRVNLGVNAGAFPVDSWDMSAQGQNVTIAWSDNRNGTVTSARRDVFALRSTNYGATFPALPDRIDLGTGPGVADSIDVTLSENANGYVAIYSDCRNSDISDCRYVPVAPETHRPQADFFSGGYAASFDANDADADGLVRERDNCPDFPNATQYDLDSDGVGDLCDSFIDDPQNDRDADGYASYSDNCPNVTNNGQEDTDRDGWGDFCDLCPGTNDTLQRDLDRDGTGDTCDTNVDGDALADTSDPDDDNDGVPDTSDKCRTVPDRRQLDANANGVGDECDPSDLIVSNVRLLPDAPRPVRSTWDKETGAVGYNVYVGPVNRLSLSALKGATPPMYCYAPDLKFHGASVPIDPRPGEAYYFLVTAKTAATQGSAGLLPDGTQWPKVTCTTALARDWDNDTVLNLADNCRFNANANQADRDRDLAGDVCDRFPDDPLKW